MRLTFVLQWYLCCCQRALKTAFTTTDDRRQQSYMQHWKVMNKEKGNGKNHGIKRKHFFVNSEELSVWISEFQVQDISNTSHIITAQWYLFPNWLNLGNFVKNCGGNAFLLPVIFVSYLSCHKIETESPLISLILYCSHKTNAFLAGSEFQRNNVSYGLFVIMESDFRSPVPQS